MNYEPSTPIVAYKAFETDFSCRDFKYEVGKTYVHQGELDVCLSGFHACEFGLDVMRYYPPTSRFAAVECSGEIQKRYENMASKRLTVKVELSLLDLVRQSLVKVFSGEHKVPTAEINIGRVVAGQRFERDYNCRLVANTIDEQITVSDEPFSLIGGVGASTVTVAKSYQALAANVGCWSVSVCEDSHSLAAASGVRSAAICESFNSLAAVSGSESAAVVASFKSLAAASGTSSSAEAMKIGSVAIAIGTMSKVRAVNGAAIVGVYYDKYGTLVHIRAGIVGEDGLEEGKWYTLNADAEFVEVEE